MKTALHCAHIYSRHAQQLKVHARIRRVVEQGVRTPHEESQSYRISKQYWSGFPEKSHRYQASIQCWAIIGPPAKRHVNNDDSLAGCGPLFAVFGSSFSSSLKKFKDGQLSFKENVFVLW